MVNPRFLLHLLPAEGSVVGEAVRIEGVAEIPAVFHVQHRCGVVLPTAAADSRFRNFLRRGGRIDCGEAGACAFCSILILPEALYIARGNAEGVSGFVLQAADGNCEGLAVGVGLLYLSVRADGYAASKSRGGLDVLVVGEDYVRAPVCGYPACAVFWADADKQGGFHFIDMFRVRFAAESDKQCGENQ